MDSADMSLTSPMLIFNILLIMLGQFLNVQNKSFQDMFEKALFGKRKKQRGLKKRKVTHRKDKQDEHKISRLEIMCNLAAEESI